MYSPNCFMTLHDTKNNWDNILQYINGKPLKTLFINSIRNLETFKDNVKNFNLQDYNWLLYADSNRSQARNIEQRSDLNFINDFSYFHC